jgi:penicillin-binding protein 1C
MKRRINKIPARLRIPAGIAGAVLILYLSAVLLPYPELDAFMHRPCSTRVYDRAGNLIQVLPLGNGMRREEYPLSEIPAQLQTIFISAEDSGFYRHGGIDFAAAARALFQNRKSGRIVSGASTITMQLARMVHPRIPGRKVTMRLKAAEAFAAVRIEAKLSKKQILALYLNSLPFGNRIEGIGSASRSFYGKEPRELTPCQMLALSVVPRRPSLYSPLSGSADGFDSAVKTAAKAGIVFSRAEWDRETPAVRYEYPQECPHYMLYLRSRYASSGRRMPARLDTSIDMFLQHSIEHELRTQLLRYADARVTDGAALVIDNATGEPAAYVGSGNFYDTDDGQIDGVLVRNQAGSSMKPFLYALALEHGFQPSDTLPDIPQDFGGSRVYVPLNFNSRYNGPQLMRVCLASSLNIPAVYILYHIGIDAYMAKLSELGFASLDGTRSSTGLSLALGSGEVTLHELVTAFSVFPRDGLLPGGQRVYKADTTRIICDFLSDKNARSLGFGFAQVFDTPYPAIFKTGTSNQFQDIVALGAVSGYTAGVWLGNFGGETVIRKTGSSIPAGIVRRILDYLVERDGPAAAQAFRQPVLWKKHRICALSGMAAGPDCPAVTLEYRAEDAPACTWHYRTGGRTVVRYPSRYQHYASGSNMAPVFEQGGISPLAILYPTDGASFVYDRTIPSHIQMLTVEAYGGRTDTAELSIDGKNRGRAHGRFAWSVPLERGTHTITVRCAGEETVSTYTAE